MRLFVFIFICVLMPARAFSQSAELGVAAIGVVVSDIEVSERFYTEVIGMQQDTETKSSKTAAG